MTKKSMNRGDSSLYSRHERSSTFNSHYMLLEQLEQELLPIPIVVGLTQASCHEKLYLPIDSSLLRTNCFQFFFNSNFIYQPWLHIKACLLLVSRPTFFSFETYSCLFVKSNLKFVFFKLLEHHHFFFTILDNYKFRSSML